MMVSLAQTSLPRVARVRGGVATRKVMLYSSHERCATRTPVGLLRHHVTACGLTLLILINSLSLSLSLSLDYGPWSEVINSRGRPQPYQQRRGQSCLDYLDRATVRSQPRSSQLSLSLSLSLTHTHTHTHSAYSDDSDTVIVEGPRAQAVKLTAHHSSLTRTCRLSRVTGCPLACTSCS